MPYKIDSLGIYRPSNSIKHRDDEYDQAGFSILLSMQKSHFWYRGRHRFLLESVDRFTSTQNAPLAAVDLGGGVGGWVQYLANRRPTKFSTLALADSSEMALNLTKEAVSGDFDRYQIDLMNLEWENEWDIGFLLDVIEHIPDDVEALRQAAKALKPGGYLFVTTPALMQFWSYNDEIGHHIRRYNRNDYHNLAKSAGLEICDVRYFMFFLSPLYFLSRLKPGINKLSEKEKKELVIKQHQTPSFLINETLSIVFEAETPIGHRFKFPWGTSILGVFRKPKS